MERRENVAQMKIIDGCSPCCVRIYEIYIYFIRNNWIVLSLCPFVFCLGTLTCRVVFPWITSVPCYLPEGGLIFDFTRLSACGNNNISCNLRDHTLEHVHFSSPSSSCNFPWTLPLSRKLPVKISERICVDYFLIRKRAQMRWPTVSFGCMNFHSYFFKIVFKARSSIALKWRDYNF